MVVECLDHRASQETEVRRESPAIQGCLCLVPQDGQGILVRRVNRDSLDLQAFPQQDKTASLESPGGPVCREREVTQERQARKVKRATPV